MERGKKRNGDRAMWRVEGKLRDFFLSYWGGDLVRCNGGKKGSIGEGRGGEGSERATIARDFATLSGRSSTIINSDPEKSAWQDETKLGEVRRGEARRYDATVGAKRVLASPSRLRPDHRSISRAKTFARARVEEGTRGRHAQKQTSGRRARHRGHVVVATIGLPSRDASDRVRLRDSRSPPSRLPFPHENPGELIFDKGPLNFFVKQNLTRCRRALENPGKKYLRAQGRGGDSCGRLGSSLGR